MKLDELHVGNRDPGAQRHRDAVTGRLDGIGRDRVHLSRAAACENHLGGLDTLQPALGVEGDDARAPGAFEDEIEGEPTL